MLFDLRLSGSATLDAATSAEASAAHRTCGRLLQRWIALFLLSDQPVA